MTNTQWSNSEGRFLCVHTFRGNYFHGCEDTSAGIPRLTMIPSQKTRSQASTISEYDLHDHAWCSAAHQVTCHKSITSWRPNEPLGDSSDDKRHLNPHNWCLTMAGEWIHYDKFTSYLENNWAKSISWEELLPAPPCWLGYSVSSTFVLYQGLDVCTPTKFIW